METSGRNCRSLRRSLSLVISFLLFLSGPSPVMRLSKMTPPQHIAAPQLRPAASFPIKASDHSGASQFHSRISLKCAVSAMGCDRIQRLVERPSQMINFVSEYPGRTIQKLRQIVGLLFHLNMQREPSRLSALYLLHRGNSVRTNLPTDHSSQPMDYVRIAPLHFPGLSNRAHFL